MDYNRIKDKVIQFIANLKSKIGCCNKHNDTKWIKIAESESDESMSNLALLADDFACDIAIVVIDSSVNCIGISSTDTKIAYNPETKDLYLGINEGDLNDVKFSSEHDKNIGTRYLSKLVPVDKLPDNCIISEINK